MKPEEKPKYVAEARQLLGSINIDYLVANHNDLQEIKKINRLVVIFDNFSSNDGQELQRLLQEFQKWARRSTSTGTIRNRAVDMLQFIDQKIEAMNLYEIRDKEVDTKQNGNHEELLTLRPEFYGMSINLKEIWRRLKWWRKKKLTE